MDDFKRPNDVFHRENEGAKNWSQVVGSRLNYEILANSVPFRVDSPVSSDSKGSPQSNDIEKKKKQKKKDKRSKPRGGASENKVKYKTEPCIHWTKNGTCEFVSCFGMSSSID
jgi:hypothetical protein